MPTDTRVFEFADFRIDAEERALYREGSRIRLAPKVFDTLFALVSRAGRVVSKDTLMEEIWQTTFVEENNLTQHIFTLRRILGEKKDGPKFIETVSRRGYRFVPEVKIVAASENVSAAVAGVSAPPIEASQINNAHQLNWDSNDDVRKEDVSIAELPSSGSARAKNPTSPTFVVVLIAAIALIGSFGFAVRSGWTSPDSKSVGLRRLTASGNVWGASVSPDGKSLAYVVRDGTTHSLRLRNIQTESEVVVVPPADVRLGNPRFSPDGNSIYLARNEEVIRLPVYGGESNRIATNLWSNFSVSPDGNEIAFPRDTTPGGSSSIIVASTNGGSERVVSTRSSPDFYVGWGPAPVFSLDGKTLTAIGGRHDSDKVNIVEIDRETGEERDLKMDAVWETVEYIDWRSKNELWVSGKQKGEDGAQIWRVKLPEGSVDRVTNDFTNYLSFTLDSDKSTVVALQETENLHLWRFDAETGAAQQITSGVSRSEGRYGLAYAPDGQIVFTARDKNDYDIYSVSASGGEVHQLTKSVGRNLDAVVSPDNQFIAFMSDRTGLSRIWLMNRDGTGARQLTPTGTDAEIAESSPYFSPDGRSVYYVSRVSGQDSIQHVSIEGGYQHTVDVSGRGADKPVPSPDGKFLAHAVYNAAASSPWQIAVASLAEDGTSERYFDFPAFRSRIRWAGGSDSIVSVDDRTGGFNLWMTNLKSGERTRITNFKTDKIYRFDVSPDRRSYVLALGDYFYDAVLIQP